MAVPRFGFCGLRILSRREHAPAADSLEAHALPPSHLSAFSALILS